MRIRVLDLFCGAGGAAVGYYRAFVVAGFEVEIVGVDIKKQPHYPYNFVQADAMAISFDGYDFIHASPPCQAYSVGSCASRYSGKSYPDLLPAMRERLQQTSVTWVIENVTSAPIQSGIQLCGLQFGLKVLRHRWFESSVLLWSPKPCRHYRGMTRKAARPSEGKRAINGDYFTVTAFGKGSVAEWREAMGIDWMTGDELTQAIPPAYTEWLGRQLIPVITDRKAA